MRASVANGRGSTGFDRMDPAGLGAGHPTSKTRQPTKNTEWRIPESFRCNDAPTTPFYHPSTPLPRTRSVLRSLRWRNCASHSMSSTCYWQTLSCSVCRWSLQNPPIVASPKGSRTTANGMGMRRFISARDWRGCSHAENERGVWAGCLFEKGGFRGGSACVARGFRGSCEWRYPRWWKVC